MNTKTLKSEFKKIIWPDRKTVARETAAVAGIGIAMGVILAVMDTIIKVGLNFLI